MLTGNATIGSSLTTETFTIAANQQQIALASDSVESVFLNGLLVTDFSLSGSTLTFPGCLAEGDFVVVKS